MAPESERSQSEVQNPISDWVFEIVPLHGAVSPADRFDQLAKVADNLEASTSVPIEEAFDVAGETRETHRQMVELAEERGVVDEDQAQSLIDCMDRVLTNWVQSPTEIDAELAEYHSELEGIRAESVEEGDV